MKTNRGIIEEDIKKLLKKHNILLRGSIDFPQKEVPKIGTLALWLLKKCGATVQLRVVPRS